MPADPEDEVVEPFRLTGGFLAFFGLLVLPAAVALAIFVGAALVADEVNAAPASRLAGSVSARGEYGQHEEVAGWKRTLVGICPIH